MKKLFLIFGFICICSLNAKCQTLKETENFINVKLTAFANPNGHFIINDLDTCLCISGQFRNMCFFNFFKPNEILQVITYEAPNGNTNIKILSLDAAIKRVHFDCSEDSATRDYKNSVSNEVNIVLNGSKDEILKIKKALIYLITKKGGHLINDNLF